jgi:hypothetical protein
MSSKLVQPIVGEKWQKSIQHSLTSWGSTVVEHLPQKHKVEGLSVAATVGIERGNGTKCLTLIVQQG